MGTAKSATQKAAPTERDQFWLDHEKALGSSGKTAKDYAATHGLKLPAFYQARKRLRGLGLLAAVAGRRPRVRERSRSDTLSFSKITVTPTADARFRVEMPGGVALAWSGGEVPEAVVTLLERLARRA